MRRITLIAAALLGAAVPAQAQQPVPPTVTLPAAMDRVLRDYEDAWRARDAARLASLFHDDGFVLSSGAPPVRGRAAIERHYANAGGALHLRAISFAAGDTIAYVIGMFRGSDRIEGGKFVLALRRSTTTQPWLIAADIDNPNQRREQP
jgi:ketosteroid isomerase-like protein